MIGGKSTRRLVFTTLGALLILACDYEINQNEGA